MKMILRAAACGLLALSLAACTTTAPVTGSTGTVTPPTATPTATDKAKASIEAACRYEPAVYQAWWIASAFVKVSDKTSATVDAAHAIASDLCASPPAFADAAGWADAARRVLAAYTTVKAARDAAKKEA